MTNREDRAYAKRDNAILVDMMTFGSEEFTDIAMLSESFDTSIKLAIQRKHITSEPKDVTIVIIEYNYRACDVLAKYIDSIKQVFKEVVTDAQ